MKVTLIYSALFLCLGVSLAYGDDITTLDGKTYYQANVISKTGSSPKWKVKLI